MRAREAITLRSVFLLCCGVFGVGIGFWLQRTGKPARAPRELRELKSELTAMRRQSAESRTTWDNVKIPTYSDSGPCVAEVEAESMSCPSLGAGKVYLTKPYVRRYNERGQLVMELWGDRGEADVDEHGSYSDVTVRGNTRMKRYAVKEEPGGRIAED